jgi:hypothetical protein
LLAEVPRVCLQKSYTELTEAELEKIDMDSSFEEPPPMVDIDDKKDTPTWLKVIAVGVTLAVAGYAIAQTPVGTWLAEEAAITSVLIQKISAVFSSIMDKIPWPAPVHGAESIWETITILFASVLVRAV